MYQKCNKNLTIAEDKDIDEFKRLAESVCKAEWLYCANRVKLQEAAQAESVEDFNSVSLTIIRFYHFVFGSNHSIKYFTRPQHRLGMIIRLVLIAFSSKIRRSTQNL